jgi:very-short-patch-repair endonuclease
VDPDVAVSRIAARQHSLIAYEQARACGLSENAIRHRQVTGRWNRVRRGVFAIAGGPATWEQAVMAAVLASGEGAVASHMTAAVLWELPNVVTERIEITTDRPHWVRLPGVRSHRTVAFLAMEHTTRRAIPVTALARTIVDLSSRLSIGHLGQATDFAGRRRGMQLRDLQRCVAGLPPAPGRKPSRVHTVLRARIRGYDEAESELEMRVLRAIVGAGLREPAQQHRVQLGRRRCRIDLAYPESNVAIERDGFDSHGSRTAFDADRARENELVLAGWRVLRFTSAFTDEQVAETVAAALAGLAQKPGA